MIDPGMIDPAFDQHCMRLAMAQAEQAETLGEVPVGAVLVKDGVVIAAAHNQTISQNNPTAHAEILVLQAAGRALGNYRLIDCDLYVTLEPCMMCAGSLVHARVRRLIYGASDPKTGMISSVEKGLEMPHHNHQIEVTAGVMAEACGTQLSAFFKQRRAAKKSKRCE